MAKIISIIKATRKIPLTALMIETLRAACKRQSNHQHIGQVDLDGSFISLFNRGLIDVKTIKTNCGSRISWYVTKAGIASLSDLEFNEPCNM
jgi:hypothetical protein